MTPNYLLCVQCRSQLLLKWPSSSNTPDAAVARVPNYTLTPYIFLNSSVVTAVRLIQCSSCLETVGYTFSYQSSTTPPNKIVSITPVADVNPHPLKTFVDQLEVLEMDIAFRRIPMNEHRLDGVCCWYGERVISIELL